MPVSMPPRARPPRCSSVGGDCTPYGRSAAQLPLSALLGCSTAHVYDLCERSQLPHYRDPQNAIRFDCGALGELLGLGQQIPTATRSGDA
jgi:hypothetical protein